MKKLINLIFNKFCYKVQPLEIKMEPVLKKKKLETEEIQEYFLFLSLALFKEK